MHPLPTLHTERLILRAPCSADFDRWADMMADEQTARHIGGVQPPAMVWRSLMTMIGAWVETGVAMFSVIERASGRWIGRVGPWQPHGWPGPEVGWSLHRDAWGHGYATEAAAASMDYAIDVLGWQEIIHTIAPDNAPSKAVAKRLGATLRGPGQLPAPFHEVEVEIWGQGADSWRRTRR